MIPRGLPDLGAPVGAGFAAFGRDGLVLSVPERLELAMRPDGLASLLVTVERSLALPPCGLLELGFTAPASSPAADLRGGVLEVVVALGVLAPLVPPVTLSASQLSGARVVIPLSADAAVLTSRLIADATVPVHAAVRLAFAAVAPRAPFKGRFNPRNLAELLATRFGSGATVPRETLGRALGELLGVGPWAPWTPR